MVGVSASQMEARMFLVILLFYVYVSIANCAQNLQVFLF